MKNGNGTILLTGFPRQLTRLTIQKLGPTGRRLAVLTSEDFEEDARAALQEFNGKVLIGSPTQLDLGLSGEEVKELQKEVDEIHHQVDAFHSKPSRMRESLVEGTRSLLEFSLDLPRLKRFVHYSSIFSTGWNKGLVVANARNPLIRRWHNAYERVRWEAEQWVFASMAQIPSIIIRAGLLTGAPGNPLDETERSFHLLKRFVGRSTQIPLPLPEGGAFPLHICPTSYLVEVVQSLVAHSGAIGAAFHVTDPTPPTASEVLLSLGGALPEEENPWTDRLSSWINQLPGVSPPPGAIQGYVSKEVWYELGSTRATLEGGCPLCPSFSVYCEELGQAIGTRDSTPS